MYPHSLRAPLTRRPSSEEFMAMPRRRHHERRSPRASSGSIWMRILGVRFALCPPQSRRERASSGIAIPP